MAKAVPVAPSPAIWNYRTRIDLAFGCRHYPEPPPKDFVRETVLGFKREQVVLDDRQLNAVSARRRGGLFGAVRSGCASETSWRSLEIEDGSARAVRPRTGTGERMVVLVTNEGVIDGQSFVDTVQSAWPCTSILHAVYRGRAEVTAADEVRVLYGKAHITEELQVPDGDGARTFRLRISPFGFSQTNSAATEILYGTIRQWVKEGRPRFVYDLYGGSGGIAFSVSDKVDRVISVESEEIASIDGSFNREAIDADNVFLTQNVEDYLRDAISMQHGLLPRAWSSSIRPRGSAPKAIKRCSR